MQRTVTAGGNFMKYAGWVLSIGQFDRLVGFAPNPYYSKMYRSHMMKFEGGVLLPRCDQRMFL